MSPVLGLVPLAVWRENIKIRRKEKKGKHVVVFGCLIWCLLLLRWYWSKQAGGSQDTLNYFFSIYFFNICEGNDCMRHWNLDCCDVH